MQQESFEQVFKRHYPSMVRWAASYIGNQEEAEDLTLEAMMYYWERREELPADTNIPAYVLTTLKHKCLNYLTKKAHDLEVQDKMREQMEEELMFRSRMLEACDPQEIYSKEIREIVRATFTQLPARTTEIFRLSREKNLTNQQIAQHYSITLKAVEYHITRALKALRENLREYLPMVLGLGIIYLLLH